MFLSHWYGDLFTLKTRKIFVFTECVTQFSLFAYGWGIRSAMLNKVTRLTLGAAENPPVVYSAAQPSLTRTTQRAHMALAVDSALAHTSMDDCNMMPVPERGGRMPMIMLVSEFVKLFSAPGPRMHESQIN